MLTALPFALISLVWMVAGVAMLANPAWWSRLVKIWMAERLLLFFVLQGVLLGGLILLVGASPQGSWPWMSLGALWVVVAL